ncbi:hypothetical protein CEXT_650961 [Caerostris extrusa]|uniref:Uncharacterized protein n=1 Tax=Caerostris extrusa TaxID=172846 RepID=A0AAV4XZP9_CAEEX|nr:hypothetical protein CEXT_650961 [Caerostris extrusa]
MANPVQQKKNRNEFFGLFYEHYISAALFIVQANIYQAIQFAFNCFAGSVSDYVNAQQNSSNELLDKISGTEHFCCVIYRPSYQPIQFAFDSFAASVQTA